MRRLLTIACLLLAAAVPGWADGGTTITLDGTTFAVDTTEYYQIAPGAVRFTLRLNAPARPVVAYCMEVDLDNEYCELKAMKGQDHVVGLETVQSMCTRANNRSTEREYVCGVNADYFYMSTSYPVAASHTIIDGEPYSVHINPVYSTCCMDGDGTFYLGSMSQNISVRWTGIAATTIGYLNEPFDDLAAKDGQTRPVAIALFTDRCGTHTLTATDGSVMEVVLRLPEGERLGAGRGKRVTTTVVGEPSTAGNATIPAGCMVLSTRDATFKKKMASLKEGTEVTVTPTFVIGGQSKTSYEFAMGGLPMLLNNGKIAFNGNEIDHLPVAGPRTLIGYGADKRHITIVAMDGRQAYSTGLTAYEAVDFSKFLGLKTVMNFDGGGSTTMYDKNFGLINKPSAGAQRTVADGLFVCSTAPRDAAVDSIAFADYRPTVGQGRKYAARVVGYNKYGAVVSTDVAAARLSVDKALGTVSGHVVTATGHVGTYTLKATYAGRTITQTLRVVEADEEEEIPDVDNGTASRGQFAYKLSSTLGGETYTFSYYLTGQAGVSLRLTSEADTVLFDQGQQTAGRKTIRLRRDQIPEGEWQWAIVVTTNEGTAAKPFYTGVPKSPRGVAINTNPLSPHFQEMYAFDPYTAGGMGMYVVKPDLTAVNTKGYGAGLFATTGTTHPLRGTINYNNDHIYWSSWNDEDGGIYMVSPDGLSSSATFTNFFAGTVAADGRTTYGGKIVGGSTSGVSIYGTGEETTLWAFEEDVPGAGRAGQNLCRYDIGTSAGQWKAAPSAIYGTASALMPNTNVNVVATRRGIFLSQWRGTGNNTADAPSFVVCDTEGQVLFNGYSLLSTLQGSLIGGLAVSDDCSRMAIANGNGNINLYSITWDAAGKPSFRYRYAITNTYGSVFAMQFDYAGNLFAATSRGLIGFTVPYFGRTATTPAPEGQTVSGTLETGLDALPGTRDADRMYNLQGVQVTGATTPGIYIRKGKKVEVRR